MKTEILVGLLIELNKLRYKEKTLLKKLWLDDYFFFYAEQLDRQL